MKAATRIAFLALGAGLLAWVLAQADPGALAEQILALGLAGFAAVLLIYAVAFATDAVGWLLALPSLAVDRTWIWRAFAVRMVGEAFNNVTPLASLGGEPIKAMLLKSRYGIRYHESLASLLLAKTVNLLALLVFLAVGFWMLLGDPRVEPAYKAVAGAGLVLLGTGVALFFAVQRLRISTLTGERLSRRGVGRRVAGWLAHVREFDDRVVAFYTVHRARFGAALALAFVNWLLGALELWVVLHLLGRPIGFADAWIVEAVAQLVRAGTFFIPASIGAQEGAFMLVVEALTGSNLLGLAVALIRRGRELVWIAAGLVLGWVISRRPGTPQAPQSQ